VTQRTIPGTRDDRSPRSIRRRGRRSSFLAPLAVVAVLAVLVASGCSGSVGESLGGAEAARRRAEPGAPGPGGTGPFADPGGGRLAAELDEWTVVCMGVDRPVTMVVRGAVPGEEVQLSATHEGRRIAMVPSRVTAGPDGSFSLSWACPPSAAPTSWVVRFVSADGEREGDVEVRGVAPTEPTVAPPVTTAPAVPTKPLSVEVVEDPFVCDGVSRRFVVVRGAVEWEAVRLGVNGAVVAEQPADAAGEADLRWRCEPGAEGTLTFEVSAASGASASFQASGVVPPPPPPPPPTPPPPPPSTTEAPRVRIVYTEEPFRCDGGSRYFAVLSGFGPGETVLFRSPGIATLNPGRADGTGELEVRWRCEPSFAGRTWDVTATGQQTGRSITFRIVGA
jgi:hypothetical protein